MSSDPDAPREVPAAIGRYRVLERLTGSRYDDVYKGFDPMIERHIVIKAFSLDGVAVPAADTIRQAFFTEMQRIGLLAHPGITTLFDAGELPGGLFLATEFVEGVSLADHLDTGPSTSLAERVSVVVQLADALDYAREQGVPHLHLKPTTVLVGTDFTPKIRGFGVAGVEDALEAAGHTPDAGDRAFRSEWLAPERLAGEGGDGRSDVYSLARIAARLLPDAPASGGAAFADAIAKGVAASPADRFPTAGAFEYALLLSLGLDEVVVRTAWESTREATSVQTADTSSLAGLPHSAVQGDLTTLLEPTHMSPSGVEEMATRLAPAEQVLRGDDPPKPA